MVVTYTSTITTITTTKDAIHFNHVSIFDFNFEFSLNVTSITYSPIPSYDYLGNMYLVRC